ncbi:MAG: hypothetical protein CSA22_09445 [Deltaproteobacteria bacterium]|nr:MAG: hypothetical protein CSA22_09445 [Deltaproteobacteria bacterium]
MIILLELFSFLLNILLFIWLLFLGILAFFSLKSRKLDSTAADGQRELPVFGVLIPAHNEEKLLFKTLETLNAAAYPKEKCLVHVIADNCTDATAQIAVAAGVDCHERKDEVNQGKGFALRFGLKKILENSTIDAVVMLDADALVSKDFFIRLAVDLEQGARIIQGRYRVADPDDGWLRHLTALAMDLKQLWQYPGLHRFGIFPPLRGSGMCFRRDILEKYGWDSTSLTEDFDQSITFLEQGEQVVFDVQAVVDHYMPRDLTAAAVQRMRWSAGEIETGKKRLLRQLRKAIIKRHPVALMHVLYLGAPPFSVNFAVSCVAMLAALLAVLLGASPAVLFFSGALVILHSAYFLLGTSEIGMGNKTLGAMLFIPFYAVWRIMIHSKAIFRSPKIKVNWIRTPRGDVPRNRPLRIAMIGTRGIPACYGGFETCVEEVSRRLIDRGHDVTVYCRQSYYSEHSDTFLGVKRVHLPCISKKSLETLSHTFLSVLHGMTRNYDLYMVFNAANAVCLFPLRLLGRNIIINTDGLEWKRSKWGAVGRFFYKISEKISCVIANVLISDCEGIQAYYRKTHGCDSQVIAYGASIESCNPKRHLESLGVTQHKYFLQITRFEPENNPLLTVRAFNRLQTDAKLVMVGAAAFPSDYARAIVDEANDRVIFTGYCYDQDVLRELRCNCLAYVHGNEVGGTNPALLQAMASGGFVLARDVDFNKNVLRNCGRFFSKNVASLAEGMQWVLDNADHLDSFKIKGMQRIQEHYNWEHVTRKYEHVFVQVATGHFSWQPRWPYP